MSHSRRAFLKASTAVAAGAVGRVFESALAAQAVASPAVSFVDTPVLRIAYEESGSPGGTPIVLLHGFPDDARAFDGVVPPLVKAGYRVLVPYLRGFGPTRFLSAASPRMAEQAAIGQDVIDFADALKLPPFAVSGFDWGGRAAAVAAALYPQRVRAAVLVAGYTIQNTVTQGPPPSPDAAYRTWYQYYFNTEQGRATLTASRAAFCRLLWQLWSPTWKFSEAEFARTAASFDNPDFVDVVIHSYRHRNFNAPGEARFAVVEAQLAKRPPILARSITLYGADDGIVRPGRDVTPAERAVFPNLVARRVIDGVGHFMPRERPDAVSSALLELLA